MPTLRNESEEEERNDNSSIIIFLSSSISAKFIIVNHNKDIKATFLLTEIKITFLRKCKLNNKIIVNDI